MSFKEAAITILGKAKRPLSPKEIYELAIQSGLIDSKGKTPVNTLGAVIYTDIKKNGTNSPFQKVGKAKFSLRDKFAPNFRKQSFKEAAYYVLKEAKKPMKSEEIARVALQRKLISTEGKTPEASMGARLYQDVKDKDSVFVKLGKNLFGLKEWYESVIQKQKKAKEKRRLNSETRSNEKRPVVGDPINVGGLTYGPLNENGVIFLFAKLHEQLDIIIESIQDGFPDACGRRKTNKGWEEVWIEFEFKSSNFKQHRHDPEKCNIIVCWEHDWPECPPHLEVIELKKIVNKQATHHPE